ALLQHGHATVDEVAHALFELALDLLADAAEETAGGARAEADDTAQAATAGRDREGFVDEARERLLQHGARRVAHVLVGDHLVDERTRDRRGMTEHRGHGVAHRIGEPYAERQRRGAQAIEDAHT